MSSRHTDIIPTSLSVSEAILQRRIRYEVDPNECCTGKDMRARLVVPSA